MIIKVDQKQEKVAVVRECGAIVGIYSNADMAKGHAAWLANGYTAANKYKVACRWELAKDVLPVINQIVRAFRTMHFSQNNDWVYFGNQEKQWMIDFVSLFA